MVISLCRVKPSLFKPKPLHFPFYFSCTELKSVAALCVLCQPLLKNCLSSISGYNAVHWKSYFVLSACVFKYILDYVLSQGSIHLIPEYWSPDARRHLPTRLMLSTRIIPLTIWAGVLRAGRQVSLSDCRRQPSSCPTTDRADFQKCNERRPEADKSWMLFWQMLPCLMELCVTAFPSTIWQYRKMTRFVRSPGWHLSCSTWSSGWRDHSQVRSRHHRQAHC